MNRYAVIVAGGQGTRFKSILPKQFLMVNDRPVLMHTLERFYNDNTKIILALSSDYHDYWKEICKNHGFNIPHQIADGGNTRAESVLNGLKITEKNSLVAIHDGVRPCVSSSLIEKLFDEAGKHGNAVPAVKLKESLRELNGNDSYAVDRDQYRIIQTPQCFRTNELLEAFQNTDYNLFTDEASLYEQTGRKIHLIEGEYGNIKITFPEDMLFASSYLKQ